MMNNTTVELKDEKAKTAMLGIMKEISEELSKIEASRDQIKEIINAAHDAFDIEKPMLRKVSKLYHKQNIHEFENETNDVKDLYNQITIR
jgi:hypothetical protein